MSHIFLQDGTKRLSFAIVGPPHLETVNRLLYATYHNYEPLTKHLGLCKGLNSMKDVDKEVEQILVKNLTLLAYDDEGKPVGVAVNNSCCKEEMKVTMEEALDGVEESYRPIQAIHHTLRRQNSHIYEEIGTDKMFSIRMIGVEVESRGQGVATNLIRRSILLAGCLGFRAIKAEATGNFGMKTFATVGMQPASSIRFFDQHRFNILTFQPPGMLILSSRAGRYLKASDQVKLILREILTQKSLS